MSMSSIAAMVMSIKNNKRTRKSTFKKIREKWELFKKNKIIFYKNVSKKTAKKYLREHNKRKQKRPY